MPGTATEETHAHDLPRLEEYATQEMGRREFTAGGRRYVDALKAWFREHHQELKRRTPHAFARAHDLLIQAAYMRAVADWEAGGDPVPTLAVIAMGGYGRRALYLESDIDLMLLMNTVDEPHQEFVKNLLHLLIDLRLNLGYSTRTIDECLERVGTDLDSVTAMTESRLLAGNRGLFTKYSDAIEQSVRGKNHKWFVKAVYDQWRERREQYDSTVYLLEPNVKEGKGGLRDFHAVTWVLFSITGSTALKQLLGSDPDVEFDRGFTEKELREYREAIAMIELVRNHLHVVANTKTDQLSFAYQPAVAEVMGYTADDHRAAVEVFLGDYYKHARAVARYSERALHSIIQRDRPMLGELFGAFKRRRLDKHLILVNNVVHVDPNSPEYFREDTRRIFELFERTARWGYMISDATLDRLAWLAPDLGPAFRLDPENSRRFLQILKGPWNVGRTLSAMHECGVLGRFLPEFERLRSMVRIDHYHHYTVDEHTLRALEVAEDLRREPPGGRSFAGKMAQYVKRWDLLNMALLFHDVGKGYGRGHALRGGQIVKRVGDRLKMPAEDIEVVRFLILSHLKMTHVAQRRDLSDPRVAQQMAQEVGSLDRLRMLYVHTICDLKAVSPDALNEWKDALLTECYSQTAQVFGEPDRRHRPPAPRADVIRDRVVEAILRETGSARPSKVERETLAREVEEFLKNNTDRYLQATPPQAIAHHVLALRDLDDDNVVQWHLQPDTGTGFSEIYVVALDVPGLFEYLCGALASKQLNIWSAQIFTTRDGYATNRFQITDLDNRPLSGGLRLDRLRQDLNRVIKGERTIDELMEKHKTRRLRRPEPPSPHETRVVFDNDVSPKQTVIEVRTKDKPGLLHRIARAMNENQLYIHRAIITTEAYGVVDVFYVTDLENNKLHGEPAQREIEAALITAIDRSDSDV